MELPQGMFGISLATYLLPTLSGLAAEKNYPEFRATLRHGLSTLIFLNLIASVLLVVLAEPIVRLLFEHGRFTADSTIRVSFALICLAPGLVAFSTVNILARAFYALGDTKTPMKISIVCLVLNLILAAALVVPLRQGGLGIANTLTSCLQRRTAVVCAAEETGQTGNGIAARRTCAAAGRWRLLAGSDCLGRLAVGGKIPSATRRSR